VGIRRDGHAVHYEGHLSPDGLVIEGRWWIDADPAYATGRTEGRFMLRLVEEGEAVAEAQVTNEGRGRESN
jgi:hypothetical protein